MEAEIYEAKNKDLNVNITEKQPMKMLMAVKKYLSCFYLSIDKILKMVFRYFFCSIFCL